MLSEKATKKFKQIFKKEYGVNYTDEEAQEAAFNLYGFFELLYKIDREQKLNAKQKE